MNAFALLHPYATTKGSARINRPHADYVATIHKQKSHLCGGFVWSVGDSNSRPLPCEGSALNQLS